MTTDITLAGLNHQSKTIRSWLEKLLAERFGIIFTLDAIAPNKLHLKWEGTNHGIIFDKLVNDFLLASGDLPCSEWSPQKEGWQYIIKPDIPSPGVSNLPSPLIEDNESNFIVHYDILGMIYWMLTRQEEISPKKLDNFGRFLAPQSHSFKFNYLDRPIVDEWLEVLSQIILRVSPNLKLKQHKFQIKLSHDVDGPSRYGFLSTKQLFIRMAADFLLRRRIFAPFIAPWVRLNTRSSLSQLDPVNTFKWIMETSEAHGLTSAFYFICGRTNPTYDADYDLGHPAIRNLMREIRLRGHEIGLHPSFETFQSPQQLKIEAQTLQNVCREEGLNLNSFGGRMHFLKWDHPKTLLACNDAGMTYDSTLSYADQPGFRCGTCHEYPAFDPINYKPLNIRIRPLIAMEASIIAERYMGLGYGEEAYNKFISLKSICRKVNGCYTLLWHNNQLNTPHAKRLYESILS